MFDFLDRSAFLRQLLKKRVDILVRSRPLYIMLVIRYYANSKKSCNNTSIYICLHCIKRQVSKTEIYKECDKLILAGYVRRSGTSYYVTELGKQVLNDINRDLSTSTYTRNPSAALKSIAPRIKVVKRPSL